MHRWAPGRCRWLGEALTAPLLVMAGVLAIRLYARTHRVRWLALGLFIIFVAIDTTFDIGARFGMWLLLHPAGPIDRIDAAFPGLHLYTWPEMVFEAGMLLVGAPVAVAALWGMREDWAASAMFATGCLLGAFLFVVLLADSGGGHLVPFRPESETVRATLKDATEFLTGMAFFLSMALHAGWERAPAP